MKFPEWLTVAGDTSFRGTCPLEAVEQVTFFSRVRREYPDTWGRIALHPRNEGDRTHYQTAKQKAEGMTKGASDIVIPGMPALVIELKRRDHTKSQWKDGQLDYLYAAQDAGAVVAVALGCDAAWTFFKKYLDRYYNQL